MGNDPLKTIASTIHTSTFAHYIKRKAFVKKMYTFYRDERDTFLL